MSFIGGRTSPPCLSLAAKEVCRVGVSLVPTLRDWIPLQSSPKFDAFAFWPASLAFVPGETVVGGHGVLLHSRCGAFVGLTTVGDRVAV